MLDVQNKIFQEREKSWYFTTKYQFFHSILMLESFKGNNVLDKSQ
jgi:hypothetical protein